MSDESEKNRRRKAMAISITLHGVLAVLFFFILAWREPNPPIPEYGIELNFGLQDVGSGEVQNPQRENADIEASESAEEPVEEEIVEDNQNVEEQPVEEETSAAIEEELAPEPEPASEEAVEEPMETQPQESPDIVNEQIEERVEEAPEVIEPADTQNTLEDDKPSETQENRTNNTTGESEVPDESTGNDGDDTDESGDKGDPKGSLDERALYGTPGDASGASLDLAGWNWDYLPQPDDPSNESGRIVFQITVDDQGYIIGIKTIEKTVTPTVEKIYRDEVSRLTFSPTSGNAMPAPTSTGKITFIIRTN